MEGAYRKWQPRSKLKMFIMPLYPDVLSRTQNMQLVQFYIIFNAVFRLLTGHYTTDSTTEPVEKSPRCVAIQGRSIFDVVADLGQLTLFTARVSGSLARLSIFKYPISRSRARSTQTCDRWPAWRTTSGETSPHVRTFHSHMGLP